VNALIVLIVSNYWFIWYCW